MKSYYSVGFAVGLTSVFWLYVFTSFLVQPVLVSQKIQYFPVVEKEMSFTGAVYVVRAMDITVEGNQSRQGFSEKYMLDRAIANKTVVFVEKYVIPLRIVGQTYVEVYGIEGPTLDGKLVKGDLLAKSFASDASYFLLFTIIVFIMISAVVVIYVFKRKVKKNET